MDVRRIGDVAIRRVEENAGPSFKPAQLYPDWTPEALEKHRSWLVPRCYHERTDRFIMSLHSWVVRTERHTILVDTCVGNDKARSRSTWDRLSTPWLDRLRATGVQPEEVDFVLCTHLHTDHVGWNTRLENGRWVPTFPNAKYIFHEKEYAAWEAEHRRGANPPGTVFRDNCLPIVEAGQALLVDDDYALDDTITLTPTPGHAPHHCCVNVHSRGQRAVVTGDMMHHAIQCREPDWSPGVDWDPQQAAVSRRSFLSSLADSDVLLLPIHFPRPTVGLVTADGDRFHYRFRRD